MSLNLFSFQRKAVELFRDRPFFALLFRVGNGKTLTASRIAEEKNLPVLIIAPKALCRQWELELTSKDERRITTKDWEVLVVTADTRKKRDFPERFEKFLQGVKDD